MASMIESADRSDTSCAAERPPKRTPTRRRLSGNATSSMAVDQSVAGKNGRNLAVWRSILAAQP
jgi:hypothetical protein